MIRIILNNKQSCENNQVLELHAQTFFSPFFFVFPMFCPFLSFCSMKWRPILTYLFVYIPPVQTGSGVHPTSYKMGTGGKAAEAWSWPLTSN
jgi:hypothetical protein